MSKFVSTAEADVFISTKESKDFYINYNTETCWPENVFVKLKIENNCPDILSLQNYFFSKNYFRIFIRESIGLEYIGPNSLQRLSAEDKITR